MSLLDLGLDAPTPPSNQQQQQQAFDPFGVPENVSTQQQSQQAQQVSFDDPFGTPQEPPNEIPQQQQSGFSPSLTDTQSGSQQTAQPHELNFGVFEGPKAPAQDAQPHAVTSGSSQETPVSSPASGNGSEGTKASAEGGSQPNPVDMKKAVDAVEASAMDNKEKLLEIEQLFGGKWRLVRSDPYGEYLKSVGVGLLTRNRAASGTPDLQISVLHEYIFVNTSSMMHSQINKFKLDEAVENVVHKTNQSVFCTYQNRKLELQMTPLDVAWSKTQGVEYSINERGELMVVYASGSNVCRRCFAKVIVVTR